MLLGVALTQHCNLRCAHCIRDDVTTVQSLSFDLIASILDQARALFGPIPVSFTGGEPLLHPQFGEIISLLAAEGHPYRFVSNGWHLARALPHLDRYAPSYVRLSLSGADAETHDAERGRGSFHRLMLSAAILTSRGIPPQLSLVIDTRTRTQLRAAADLAESLGAHELHYILPQPVAASVMRDSDLPLDAWDGVRRQIESLAAERREHVRLVLDYGFPSEGTETRCDAMSLERLYVDAWGRLATCCQLSDYGFTESEVVADLNVTPFADAYARLVPRVESLRLASAPRSNALTEKFPCLRCVRSQGKLEWLRGHARSPWSALLDGSPNTPAVTVS